MRRVVAAAVFAIALAGPAFAASDPRPERWCGWQMRQWFGVSDRRYNQAAAWADYGAPAAGPAIGVIVVWPHHVGLIVGGAPGRWLVQSGNDGGEVRTRLRSLAAAIAFRSPRSAAAAIAAANVPSARKDR